ncbi:MAG: radical SAM protein [Deltaproteobacteria bacterium]|nr:radical SAM protein [Deltaproteobacteria bacterium]
MLAYRLGPQSDPFNYIFSSDRWLKDYDPVGPFPMWVNLEPTNVCQLECFFCSRQLSDRPLGYLDLDLAKSLFSETARYPGAAVRLTGWGEPLLHPRIAELTDMIKGFGLKLKIYTNSMALTPALMEHFIKIGVDDIQFSLQGLTPEQYEFNRVKARYSQVEGKIIMASELRGDKQRPFLSVLTSVLADELAQADPVEFTQKLLKYADKVAMDLTNLNFVSGEARVKPFLGRQSKGLTRGLCVDVFLSLEVKYDGSIQFCGQDARGLPEHTIGKAPEMTLHEAWLSPAMEAKREAVGRHLGHENYTVCRDCYHNTDKYELFKNLSSSKVFK